MKIGELYTTEEKPVIEGDWIRGILVLGRNSKNPADTDGAYKGKSKVTRKFNKICESEALFSKFEATPAHIGPHKFDGSYTDDDLFGTWHNPVSGPKGLRMDILCRRIGEGYHTQAAALRDHIEHDRPFGGFSPLFEGETDMTTGEVQTIDAVCSIDWVPAAGSVKSIVEGEASEYDAGKDMGELKLKHEQLAESHEELKGEHDSLKRNHELLAESHATMKSHLIGECGPGCPYHKSKVAEETAVKVAESVATTPTSVPDVSKGARTVPIPEVKTGTSSPIDPFKFIRG